MSEEGVRARFFKHKVVLGFLSQQKGEEVSEMRDFIEIVVVGMDKQVFTSEVREEHKNRFPAEWLAYKRGEEGVVDGTLIEMCPIIPETHIKLLKTLNVLTVEDVAGLTDAGVQKIGMGGYKLRDAARKFVQSQSGDKPALDALKAENQKMKQQLAEMQEQMRLITAPPEPKKRGRPAKAQ